MSYDSMKVTQMPPVHAANLVANSGNTAYGVDVISGSEILIRADNISYRRIFLGMLSVEPTSRSLQGAVLI